MKINNLCYISIITLNIMIYAIDFNLIIDQNLEFKWKILSDNELNQWYTDTDLCMLQSNDTKTFPMKIRQKECSNLNKPIVKGCGIGFGHMGHPCYQPLSSRSHYKKGLAGFTDGKKEILSSTMVNLAKNNISLVFVGDSTTRQKVIAMDCQLKRESSRNYISPMDYSRVLPCYSKMYIGIDRGKYWLDLHQIGMGPNAVDCADKKLLKVHKLSHTRMFNNAQNIIHHINTVEKRRVFVIANMGLWFNQEDALEKSIPYVIDWLKDVSERTVNNLTNIVAWHETLHQHYDNDIGNGYYFKKMVEIEEKKRRDMNMNFSSININKWHDPFCCQSIRNFTEELDWRNHIVRRYLEHKQYLNKNIVLFPFSKATESLSDMHICHPNHKNDCTHYCLWPLLFQPLWYQMYNISMLFNQII